MKKAHKCRNFNRSHDLVAAKYSLRPALRVASALDDLTSRVLSSRRSAGWRLYARALPHSGNRWAAPSAPRVLTPIIHRSRRLLLAQAVKDGRCRTLAHLVPAAKAPNDTYSTTLFTGSSPQTTIF